MTSSTTEPMSHSSARPSIVHHRVPPVSTSESPAEAAISQSSAGRPCTNSAPSSTGRAPVSSRAV